MTKLLLAAIVAVTGVLLPVVSEAGICKENGGTNVCTPVDIGDWLYEAVWPSFILPPSTSSEQDMVDAMVAYFNTYNKDCPIVSQVLHPWPVNATERPNNIQGIGNNYYLTNGVEAQNARELALTYNPAVGETCDTTRAVPTSLIYRRIRPVACPTGFGYYPAESICVRPQADFCPFCGNPIRLANGAKTATETDIAVPGSGLLRFTRYYNSAGQFIPAGTDPEVAKQQPMPFGKNWRTNYSRRIWLPVMSTSTVLGIAERSDGMTRYFGTNGRPLENLGGGRDTLTKEVSGATHTGWSYYDAKGNVIERYDATGRLLSLNSVSGSKVYLTYSDGVGAKYPATAPSCAQSVAAASVLLICATDDFGRQLNFTYDSPGRLTQAFDVAGGTYAYAYTGKNLATVTQPDSTTRTYHFDETAYIVGTPIPPLLKGLLTGITDENGNRFAIYKYNTAGRAVSTEHAGGADKFTVGYTNPGYGQYWYGTVTETDSTGTIRTHTFQNSLDQVRRTAKAEPCATPGCSGTVADAIVYDSSGNVTTRTDYKGNRTCYQFDLTRNLETGRIEGLTSAANCASSFSAGSLAAPARKILTTWHATLAIPATVTEPTTAGSRVTTFTHDANGNVLTRSVAVAGTTRTWTYTYDAFGRVLTVADPKSNVTTNGYYANDPAQGTKRSMLATVTNAAGHVTTINSYSAHSQPLTITDANGLGTTLAYDARQRLTSRTVGSETTMYEYDFVGQLEKVTLPDSSWLRYTYDPAHRLVEIKDGLNNRIVYTLDTLGNRISEQHADPNNLLVRARTRVFDALNRLQKDIGGTNPATQITQFVYDANGNISTSTDPASRITTQTYDALNRLLQVIDPFNGSSAPTKYEYDTQDNLTKVTDPKNLATIYGYNGFNELVTQTSPDTGATSFTYDTVGNMLTKTDSRSVMATYTYDNLNRVTTIVYPAFGSDPAETVTYTHDTCANGKGRLCSLSDKTGTTSWTYDAMGRVTGKSQTVGSISQSVVYGYNSAGQLTSIVTPSGKTVTYTYQNNRPVSVAINGKNVLTQAMYEPFGPIGGWLWGNSTVQAANMHQRFYDLDYRAAQVMSDNVGAGTQIRNLAWNANDTIAAISDPANAGNSFGYGYDSLDRLTTVTGGSVLGYSYDGVGNRLTQTTAAGTTGYTYPGTSHKLSALTGMNAKSITYDAAGNRTLDGATTWTYGANNRPIAVTAGGSTSQFLINALGQRVKKTMGANITRFIYDESGRLLGEYNDAGGRIKEHIWLNDLPVAVIP